VRLRLGKNKIERRLRAARPQASESVVKAIMGEIEGARSAPARRPRLRLAGVTAGLALGVLAVGGLGYAMTYAGDFVTGVTHHIGVGTRTTVRTVVLNAANDQYGTTTTATTTTTVTTTTATTTTSPATTTNSDGSKSTSVQASSSGAVTVAAPTDTSQKTEVAWSPTTFDKPVVISVDPTPPVAAPAFLGPANDRIVSIVVTDKTTGAVIHNLAAPLEIVFSNAPKGFVPAVSEDGVNFRALVEIAGPPLPDNAQDGFYRSGDDIHIITRHLTQFAVLYKAHLSTSESGRKTQPAGSGKFGDPTRIHSGAPAVDVVNAPTAIGNDVALTFFVDEQVAVYVHVVSGDSELVLGSSSTVRKHRIGGKSRKTFHIAILRPGTINLNLHIPVGLAAGSKVQLTFVDFDGNKVEKTVEIQ
jgi:hypothetical protein